MNMNIKNITLIILIFISLIFITNCSKKKNVTSVFNIDSTLIGKSVSEKKLNIRFSPPRNWVSANTDFSKQLNRKFRFGSGTFIPIELFYNKLNKAILNFGEIIPDTSTKFNLENYIRQSIKKFDKKNIIRTNFKKNDINFKSIQITYGVWFTYRIIFTNQSGKIIQLDYSLQSKYKNNEFPAIVSSIGSIHFIKF